MKLYISSLILAVTFLPGLAMAATAEGQGHADAKIVTAVTATEDQHLNFGTMLGKANTVTVGTSDNRSASDNTALVNDGNTPKSGVFSVTGPKNQPISVSLPQNVTVQSDSNSMTITNMTNDAGAALDAQGKMTIKIGGDLTVAEGQAEGDYTGPYTITITY